MAEPKSPQNKPYVEKMEPGTYFWCSCGMSAKQPYCDGTHKGSEFRPDKVVIEEPCSKAWCGCKKTANAPYCDGSHNKI